MSENTLLNVIQSLESKFNLNPYQKKQIKKIVEYWKVGTTIYPGDIKSRTAMTIETTYKLLKELNQKGFLEKRYELYCSECHSFKGEVLKTLTDDLEDNYCDFCNHEFIVFQDTILIYQVVKLDIN
ncbi:hypothetical protein CN533_25850 [Priestia megaterium]|uniref:hypothetical protein n=1 Tax=Priestia megaterium TaxID=1404 RepID=UPI000BF7CA5D|nr:hypothetical protein [Priestia megaterium]PET68584.1 hypothetical protein CN533_25850 [Priestia megaterium]PFK84475.1 hypothetical protein COJ19_21220 [Priestia megaterium]